MNKPLLFFLIILASIAAFVTFGCHYMGNYGEAFYIGMLAEVICLGSIVWIVVRRKSQRDVLHELGLASWEREGFCFGAVPVDEQGRLALLVVYQNRYELPCQAELLFQPDADAAKGGLKTLRAKLSCPGEGDGRLTLDWGVPTALMGKEVSVGVGADVDYPAGRGRLVRWRGGTAAGPTRSLEMGVLGLVVGQSAMISFRVPQLEAANGVTVASPQAPISPPDPASIQPTHHTAEPVVGNGGDPHLAPSPRTGAMPTIPGEALTLKALSALLETMGHSDAMQRQRHFVKAAKVSEATQGFGLGILLTLGGAGLATYGVYALMEGWRAPMRVMSVVLGGFGFLIGLVMLPASVACLRAASKVLFARKPEEAFRGAVEPALKSFRQFANSWISIVEFAAFPVSETYRESSEAAIALAQRWRDLRESLAADADSLRIGSIQTAPHPMLGDRVSELRLEVVYPGGTTWLRNAAVEVEGQWFLATLEPIMEPGANAASQPAPSPGTLKT